MGLWYWITAEFKALGLRCVAHGPEFWLGVTAICGAVCLSAAVCCFVFKESDKHERR